MTDPRQALLRATRDLRSRVISAQREIGDIRRNATLFASVRAGMTSSSFREHLPKSFDEARLGEAPYLAALGYLFGAGILQVPVPPALRDRVLRLARRSPHTQEHTGFADDPLIASGVLLLGQSLEVEELVSLLPNEISELTPSTPALHALVSMVLGRAGNSRCYFDDAPETVAAALLVKYSGEELAKETFPGLPSDLEERLLGFVLEQRTQPATADLESMFVLAALEAYTTRRRTEGGISCSALSENEVTGGRDSGADGFLELIDELARVIWHQDQATTLALAAGFPSASMPAFVDPRVFWTRVVRDLENGVSIRGVQALVDEAARRYPGNSAFGAFRRREQRDHRV